MLRYDADQVLILEPDAEKVDSFKSFRICKNVDSKSSGWVFFPSDSI